VDRKYEIHLQLYDEDGGRMLLWNVGTYLQNYKVLQPRT
jgi:hypothetical protein